MVKYSDGIYASTRHTGKGRHHMDLEVGRQKLPTEKGDETFWRNGEEPCLGKNPASRRLHFLFGWRGATRCEVKSTYVCMLSVGRRWGGRLWKPFHQSFCKTAWTERWGCTQAYHNSEESYPSSTKSRLRLLPCRVKIYELPIKRNVSKKKKNSQSSGKNWKYTVELMNVCNRSLMKTNFREPGFSCFRF